MADRARIAVIGAGSWSAFAHIPTLKSHPDVDLVALADINPEALAKAAEHGGVERVYTNYNELLDAESLDGVVVAVWHAAHHDTARACLERGLHMLLEKPMVLQASHARELCELADSRGLEIVMSYPWQFLPQSRRVRELLSSGRLGEIDYIVDTFASGCYPLYCGSTDKEEHDPEYADGSPGLDHVYDDPELSAGGQGHLQMTHSAALMLYLTGLRAASVQAQMNTLDTRVDVVDSCIVRLDNGALATVGSTGTCTVGEGRLDLQIYCRKGWIELEYIGLTGTVHFEDGSEEDLSPGKDAEVGYGEFTAYPAHLPCENLVDIILERGPNLSPGVYGWRSVELLDAAYQSAAQDGRVVTVDSLYA